MWFIQTKNTNGEIKFLNTIFSQKHEALKHAKKELKKNNIIDIDVKNLDRELISENIKIGGTVFLNENKKKTFYGKIIDVSDYLIEVEKESGATAIFTKSRINKELIMGNFYINCA